MLEDQKGSKNDDLNINEALSLRPKHDLQTCPSEFSEQYLQFMNISVSQNLGALKTNLLQRLALKNQSSVNADNQPCLKISLLDHTPNMEYMLLEAKYSYFTFPVSILNVNEPSQLGNTSESYQGSFSTVYRAALFKFDIAVKSNNITEGQFQKKFFDTLKEFVVFKIMQQFEGGPIMNSAFGFNLLVYTDSIQFSMEFCSHQLQSRQNIKKDLTESLLFMHLLHIIHFDIKPDNICFSNTLKKYVFIDLGLHKVVEEEIGEKTLTEFRGSMLYCSKQLADCCLKGEQYVDVYYNDTKCLEKTLNSLKECSQQIVGNVPRFYDLLQTNKFLKIIVKYLGVHINFKPLAILDKQMWECIFCQLHRLEEQSAMQIAYFLEMLTNTEMTNKVIRKLSHYIPSLKTGFIKERVLNHNLQIIDSSQAPSLFKERFNEIFQNQVMTSLSIVNHKDNISILKNENEAAIIEKQTYLYLVTKYLQVNYIGLSLDDAKKICEVFMVCELKKKVLSFGSHEDCLKKLFVFALEWIINRSTINSQTYAIIQQIVPSLILLEAVEESQLTEMLMKLMNLAASQLLRVRICLHILTSIEWIYQKYKSKYNYFRVMDAVCSFIQQQLSESKKNNLPQQQYNLIDLLNLSTNSNLGSKKRLMMMKILFEVTKTNIYQLINSNLEKDLIKKEIILYWLYYFSKFRIKAKLFSFLFDRIASQIIKRDIVIHKKVCYYYNIYINRYTSCSKFQALGPLRQLSHFSFYNQLTCVEEMRLAQSSDASKLGFDRLFKRYEQQFSRNIHPQTINFLQFFITEFKSQYRNLAPNTLLNFDFDSIFKQFQQIDKYEHYHEHELVNYFQFLNSMICQYQTLLKLTNQRQDLRISYFSKAIKVINRLQCFYCKSNALVRYNKTLRNFTSPRQRHLTQEQFLSFIINLLKIDKCKTDFLIFDLLKQCYWFYLENLQYKTKYNYLLFMHELFERVESLIISFFLRRTIDDLSTQLQMLLFIWYRRFSLTQENAFFKIILSICEYFNNFGYQVLIRQFVKFINILVQFIGDYEQFFSENQEFIIKKMRSEKHNRYLALYAALLMHPDRAKFYKISPRYLYFIWSKFHQLDAYSKTAINSFIYWASEIHILKAENAKKRRIDYFRKKEMKVVKEQSIKFSLIFTKQSINKVVKKLKKETHQRINTAKYRAIITKFKIIASCVT